MFVHRFSPLQTGALLRLAPAVNLTVEKQTMVEMICGTDEVLDGELKSEGGMMDKE